MRNRQSFLTKLSVIRTKFQDKSERRDFISFCDDFAGLSDNRSDWYPNCRRNLRYCVLCKNQDQPRFLFVMGNPIGN